MCVVVAAWAVICAGVVLARVCDGHKGWLGWE